MSPLDIEPLRRRFAGRDLRYFDSIDTTMREAARLAAAGAPAGTAVIAEEQTAGQGRHGHSWDSRKGLGLYLSIVLRPDVPREASPTLTMALGLGAAEAIGAACGIACDLRWPNDLMIGDRKAAGILVQLSEGAAIAGIGVNVNHTAFPAELEDEATSLRIECGREQSRESILVELLPAVDRYAAMLEERGAAAILELFSWRSTYASGKRVVVRQDGRLLQGTTAGVNGAGFLIVRKDDGSDEVILAGGVRAAGARRG